MSQLDALQKGQSLVNIRPKLTALAPAMSDMMGMEAPPIIIQNADGSQTQLNQPMKETVQSVTLINSTTPHMIVDENGQIQGM